MRKNLDHLQNFFFASDGWRNFVLSRQFVQRHTKMFEIRRQFVFFTSSFFFFFDFANACPRCLRDFICRHSQVLQNVIQKAAFIVGKHIKKVAGFNHSTTLGTRPIHRTLKQIGCFGCNPITAAGVLSAGFKPFFNQQFD